MTEHEPDEHVETPERTHDQPAEGGREQAEQAEQGEQGEQSEQAEQAENTGQGAEHSPATGPEGIDATPEGLEERMPGGTEPRS